MRETREETGLVLSAERLVGVIAPLRPTSPGLPSVVIWPVVFHVDSVATARARSPEVRSVHWFGVKDLADPARASRERAASAPGAPRAIYPAIRVGGRTIWGLTYRTVQRFLAVIAGRRVAESVQQTQ